MPKGIKSAPPAAPAVVNAPAVVAPAAPVAASPEPTPAITRPPLPTRERPGVSIAPAKDQGAGVQAKLAALPANAPHEQVMAAMGLAPDGSALVEGVPAVTVPAAPVADAAAADEDGADDADGALDPAAADPARPDWLKPNFRTAEDQAKAYLELEKLLGKKAGDLTTKGADPVEAAAAKGGEAWTALNEATIQEIGSEYLAKGDLSPETYAKIEEKFKIPPATAKVIVETRVQQVQAQNAQLVVDAGFATLDDFRAAQQWAVKALPAGDMQALDAMLGDNAAIRRGAAVRMLRDLFTKANPPPKAPRSAGASVVASGLVPITSAAESAAAWADPRGRQERPVGDAYRAQIVARGKAGGYAAG